MTKTATLFALIAALAAGSATAQPAAPREPLGIALEGYAYPFPVAFLPLTMEGRPVRMAYMDVAPTGAPNGQTVLLMHGRNFPAAYWEPTIRALLAEGYRVVAPDQIHFGKSSKPDDLPVNFDVMAQHTAALLDHLNIADVAVVAHSMGGMAGTRFTRSYPARVRRLALYAPVGLEDYRQYLTVAPPRERLFEAEMALTAEQYFNQLMATYSPQLTREQFWPFIELRQRMSGSAEYPRWVRSYVASFYAMWGQPVVHEFHLIRQPTLIMVGDRDRTATGRAMVAPELRERMGLFVERGREVAARMPNARLVVFEGHGHMIHMETPERFNRTLIDFLKAQ
ncbi:alpha/beta hydrolase [Phreatobacter aquaticus]|uniref:Alpha/beta hydrolase n=1 Tax=Phreatobacter aquaticus TaxID=2570229 RepID=A0A4D7QJU0_9HYPH|nr:alpha/beta hydrolase [Phreatobacter aquaticus]QCK84592.1 alpha/beta hydrolase [Phreatobacter aquaticus]